MIRFRQTYREPDEEKVADNVVCLFAVNSGFPCSGRRIGKFIVDVV